MSAIPASARLRAHLETWRPYTLWYPGLVGLAGGAVAAGSLHPWRLAAGWAAPTAGWLGAHYLGDYFDRELDGQAKPHRPIPSGRLSGRTAVLCGGGCFLALAFLAAATGWPTICVALAAGFGAVGYSRWFKAHGGVGNAVRGGLGAAALVYGALAAGTTLATRRLTALLLLTAAFWLHDTMSNLVGTLRDTSGDSAGGYQTMPVRRGTRFAVRAAALLYAGALACAAGALAGAPAGETGEPAGYLASLFVVAVLGGIALIPLLQPGEAVPARTALRAHSVLVAERVLLAGAVCGLGLGAASELALVTPAIVLTCWPLTVMRERHEFGTSVAKDAP
jgi:geranylgeranylglycerol-phosphate geranylgeranyltransferase